MSVVQEFLNTIAFDEDFLEFYEKNVRFFKGHSCNQIHELFTLKSIEPYLYAARPWEVNNSWHESGMLVTKFPEPAYTPNVTSVEEVLSLFSQGYTLIFRRVQERIHRLKHLCSELKKHTQIEMELNIYCTPPNSQGFKLHFDMHDVFILQTYGCKDWKVNDTHDSYLPLVEDKYQSEVLFENAPESLQKDYHLKKNDILYIPRGHTHQAIAQKEASIHITFGCFPNTWYGFLEKSKDLA